MQICVLDHPEKLPDQLCSMDIAGGSYHTQLLAEAGSCPTASQNKLNTVSKNSRVV